jgi:hypothetical protein
MKPLLGLVASDVTVSPSSLASCNLETISDMKIKLLLALGYFVFCSCSSLQGFVEIVTELKIFFRVGCVNILQDGEQSKY